MGPESSTKSNWVLSEQGQNIVYEPGDVDDVPVPIR